MFHSPYDLIADEFYDPSHITSRNFDAATANFLQTKRTPFPKTGLMLEVGAGRGSTMSFLSMPPDRVIQTDLSIRMLLLPDREKSKQRIASNAIASPFGPNTFSSIAAFLFDPYNVPALYQEFSRILVQNGLVIGTLPHELWGITLRRLRGYPLERTRFVTRTGVIVESTSFLSGDHDLHSRLSNAGLHLVESFDLCLPKSCGIISPDIILPARNLAISPYELPIVKLFYAIKTEASDIAKNK